MKNKEKNQAQLNIYQFALSLVSTFIEVSNSEINDAINNSLRKITEYVNSDRTYIYLFDDNDKRLILTHNHYREGIKEKIAIHEGVDREDFKWLLQPLRKNETVNISSVKALPGNTSTIKAIMEVEHTNSMMMHPIKFNEYFYGIIGVDQVENGRIFGEEVGELLSLAGGIFASALHRRNSMTHGPKTEAKYSTLFSEIEDVVFMSTPEGQFIDINPAGVKMFGYSSAAEVLNLNIEKNFYVNPEDRKKFQETIKAKGRVKDYELTIKNKSGDKIYISETSTAVRDENGKIIAYQGIMRDETYRRQLEHQLFQAKKMESIGMLAGGIAHDFNNILTTIRGYADLIMMNLESSDPIFDDIDNIIKGVKRAEELIRQLLAFSRRQMIEPRIIDINKVIKDLHTMLNRLISEDIKFELDLKENLEFIKADPAQIQQIMVNLIVNAGYSVKKQTDKSIGKRIRVSTDKFVLTKDMITQYPGSQEGVYIRISISDTGIGMTDEIKQNIFEPFYSTKNHGEKTGLGLATVYGIVKQNNSFIYIDSVQGKGTTFKILWPIAENQHRDETRIEHPIKFQQRTETILFVEDDKDVRKLSVQALKSFGYTVIDAGNGKEALDLINNQHLLPKIDLVISDIVMPEMDGEELAEHLRELNPELKILLCSGFTDSRMSMEKQKNRKGIYFIPKPYTLKNLQKMIQLIVSET